VSTIYSPDYTAATVAAYSANFDKSGVAPLAPA
jgi:hypothetical protein